MDGLGELLPGGSDGTAVFHGDERTSWAQLRERAGALAALLRGSGVSAGHAVAVLLPDSADAVAALFGVWAAGAVHVPVNPRLTGAEVARLLEAARAVVVVTDRAGAERTGGLPVVVPGERGWEASGPVGPARPHPPGTALVQTTSGTTGPPRPVLLRHDTVLALLEPVVRTLKPGGSRTPMPNLIPTSLSLWAGIYNVLFAFRVGAPVVLIGRFTTRGFADAVARFGIRSTVLPPGAMAMLSDDGTVTTLAPLRYVRSITAPLSPFQARRFRDRFGVTVLNCYGQTELGGEIVGWTAAHAREFGDTHLGAAGRPHPGVVLRIAGGDGSERPCGEAGEVLVRTPALAAGTDIGERLTPDGWFRTGDVGHVDAEGFLWIDGRVSDMINRGGLKVFPAEVEEVLMLADGVAECAVAGVPDARLGEVPWAFVVPRGGARPDAGALAALCRAHLAPYKVPVRFETVAALPRNDVGKVLRRRLVAAAGDTA